MGSRVLGLVREVVFAGMFGAGKHLDAFLAAFQIPNLLRDLFAEGALSTAFTTVFTKTHEMEGDAPAWRLTSLLLSTLTLIVGVICVFGILISPLIVQVTSFGFHEIPGKFELTVQLTRILFPFILMLSLASVVMGILNARHIFALPASASTAFNAVSVVAGVALAFVFDPQADWRHPAFSDRALFGISLGVLLGGLAQLAIQLPALWRLGYRYRWSLNFRDERLRQVWHLMLPSMIAGAAVQVNVLVNGMFASEINGARSWLSCAFRLMQFPIGVFGVAIATVTLPAVARCHARDDLAGFGRTAEQALRLAFFLTIPAAVGLAVLAPQIIGVIYERWKFSAEATAHTAAALRAYSIGLSGYAAIKVLVPCFYALNLPRTPLRISLLGMAVNLSLNLLLVKALGMGHVGLATTTSLVALINFIQLLVCLGHRVHLGRAANWLRLLAAIGAGAALCGWIAVLTCSYVAPLAGASLPGRIAALLAGMAAGALAYVGVTFACGVEETRAAIGAVKRALARKLPPRSC